MLRNTYRHNLDNGMCVFFVYIIICVVMYWGIFNVANFYRLNNIFFLRYRRLYQFYVDRIIKNLWCFYYDITYFQTPAFGRRPHHLKCFAGRQRCYDPCTVSVPRGLLGAVPQLGTGHASWILLAQDLWAYYLANLGFVYPTPTNLRLG